MGAGFFKGDLIMWAELRLLAAIMLPLSALLLGLACAGCWVMEKVYNGPDSPLRHRDD